MLGTGNDSIMEGTHSFAYDRNGHLPHPPPPPPQSFLLTSATFFSPSFAARQRGVSPSALRASTLALKMLTRARRRGREGRPVGRREENGKIDMETMRSMQKKGLTDRGKGREREREKEFLEVKHQRCMPYIPPFTAM